MKVDKRGALVVYFGDRDEWIVRVAPDSAASFLAGPRNPDGSKPVPVAGKALDQVVAEFLSEAKKEADQIGSKSAKSGQDVPSAQKLKLQTDAVLDGLIFRLEPSAAELAVK